MTKAQEALILLYEKCGTHFHMHDVKRHGLQKEFKLCVDDGLIQSAGYETSVKAEDFLNANYRG